MSSTYGEHLKLSIFGQSHGAAIGMTLDGIPAGLPVDFEVLQAFLNRRAPGRNDWSTPRKEEDRPEFLAGILDGFTCGAPIAAVIHNTNTRSGDYAIRASYDGVELGLKKVSRETARTFFPCALPVVVACNGSVKWASTSAEKPPKSPESPTKTLSTP